MSDPLGLFEDSQGSDPLGLFSEAPQGFGSKLLESVKTAPRRAAASGEAALNLVTGMGSFAPAVIGGGLAALNDITAGRRPESAQPTFEGIQKALTYEPRLPE